MWFVPGEWWQSRKESGAEDATPHSQEKVNVSKIKIDNVLIEIYKTLKISLTYK